MRLWVAALAALTLLRLILAAKLPLAPDEAYYALWAQNLQPGYFDHPPMVALFIRLGTIIAGHNPLGIRLLGPLAAALGAVLLWRAAEDFFPHRQAGFFAAALLNATLVVGVGSIVMTPDTPLLLFWTAGIAALGRLAATGNPRWWLAIGAAAGAALLSKYTGFLFILGIFVWLITTPPGRLTLRTAWPWAGLALALLIFAPNILWNADHNFVSYLKQGGRAAQFDPLRAGQFLLELVSGQIGLVTPIIFILAVAGLWRLRRAPSPAGHLLIWLTVVPAVVFLEHVISGRVQANWPAILYPAACLAAASLPMAALRTWLTPALALGFGLTAIVYAQGLTAIIPIPAKADPAALNFSGWADLTNAVQATAASQHAAFITSDDYATVSEFAAYSTPGIKIIGADARWRYFNLPAFPAGQTGILITRHQNAPCADQLGAITRTRANSVIATYKLCRFTSPSGSVLLPAP
jgi:4-amino-4-deoxy-L-arabinose transferase-like glycosyltransferase